MFSFYSIHSLFLFDMVDVHTNFESQTDFTHSKLPIVCVFCTIILLWIFLVFFQIAMRIDGVADEMTMALLQLIDMDRSVLMY